MKYFALAFLFVGVCANAQTNSIEGIRTINGSKIFIKIIGKGDPLVIIHGGPGLNHSYFLPHLESLAKHYTVIFYDQRACGRSAIPSTDSLGLNFFIDDIEAIRKELGYEKINLFGHSWGAIPAVKYGIAFPDRVSSMVLCNSVALNNASAEPVKRSKMAPADSAKRAKIMASPEFKSGRSFAYQELMQFSFRNSFHVSSNLSKLNLDLPENYMQAVKALFAGLGKDLMQYDYYGQIQKFKFPVLILHGKYDALSLSISEKIQSHVPGSKLILFENSGHFVFIEESKKFEESIIGFVK